MSGYVTTPSGEQPPPEAVKQPILERARKMAATWVTSEDGEASYRDWMEFCEDWVRHRLKQNYYEIHDVVRWERATGPPTPPHRMSAQLDQMAHDICPEAWGQATGLRDLMMALVRRCGPMIPSWVPRWRAGPHWGSSPGDGRRARSTRGRCPGDSGVRRQ